MMKTKTSIWLAAAVAAGFTMGFAGCGGDMMMMPTTCSSDTACAASEACHPILKKCVTACTSGTDCPDSAKTCATFTGLSGGNDAGVRAFCQCATDQLCDRGTSGQVCQPATKICAAKCTSNAGCPSGSTCDTATGKCGGAVATDAGTDGGTDAGMTVDAGTACTPGTCTTGICNSGLCGAPAACVAPAFQPGTCVTGQACVGTACAEVPFAAATCGNFAAGSTPRAWTPATSNGPVITELTLLDFMVDMSATPVCAGAISKRARLRIRAYDPSMPGRLTGETSQPSLRYYRTDTTSLAVTGAEIQSYMTQNSGRNADFIVNLCFPTATNSAAVGYAYENGNPVCATVQ